jgi:hypothetical protein
VNDSDSGYANQGFISLALSRLVLIRAIKVALVVGTLLTLINHGDKILAMSLTGKSLIQILLTYLVPYSVSTWSAVKAIEAQR